MAAAGAVAAAGCLLEPRLIPGQRVAPVLAMSRVAARRGAKPLARPGVLDPMRGLVAMRGPVEEAARPIPVRALAGMAGSVASLVAAAGVVGPARVDQVDRVAVAAAGAAR